MAAQFVTARSGKSLRATTAALAPLNELLAKDNTFSRVETAWRDAETGRRLLLRRVYRWENPGELLHPIAEAAADLICNQDFRLDPVVRGFGLHAAVPRPHEGPRPGWCSMSVCGNRAKAAAHRARTSAE